MLCRTIQGVIMLIIIFQIDVGLWACPILILLT